MCKDIAKLYPNILQEINASQSSKEYAMFTYIRHPEKLSESKKELIAYITKTKPIGRKAIPGTNKIDTKQKNKQKTKGHPVHKKTKEINLERE